jgi:aminoglycoside N3'-acetyltransferase
MQTLLARQDIVDSLVKLGLERGMALEVHSSMKSMGLVEGGAGAVIRALIGVVGEQGALVMSAYRVTPLIPLTEAEKSKGITAKVRKFGEHEDCQSGMGIISDTFRSWPGTCLGKGINRTCAWGKNAQLHSQGYEHLLSIDGSVLLIGVDIHRCSSMHTAEDKVEFPVQIEQHCELPEWVQREYPREDWYVEYSEPGKPAAVDAWAKVQAEAECRGFIRHGRIGDAGCMLFKARDVVGIYEEFLRADPYGLFGVEKE